jgi:hypothetical protein
MLLAAMLASFCVPQEPVSGSGAPPPVRIGNVLPQATVMAPGIGSDSETGIGALIPWADQLWAIGYVAHKKGAGIGLYSMGADLVLRQHPASVTGTFANRLVHWDSKQVFLGPHAIAADGTVRTIEALAGHRLAATCRHLVEPSKQVYFLTMEGLLFEVDVLTLAARQLVDLVDKLALPKGAQPHFKGAFSAQGRLVVANNTYEELEYLGQRRAGRLAEFDGTSWTVLEQNPFVEVAGKHNQVAGGRYGNTLYALGWDRASVILRVLHLGTWTRYRLPKGSQSFDHTWNTEWMRIREVQTERYLMDAFGTFFDLPPMVYGGTVAGIRPIATHLRICPDFLSWRGMLVLAGDQTDNAVGQPQSGLWFGHLDELWQWGKPQGWGSVWWDEEVAAGVVSDPFLMTGYEHKVVHVVNATAAATNVVVEVDVLGNGTWHPYTELTVGGNGYAHHVFPTGFSAHWVRVRACSGARLSVTFHYT